MSALRSMQVIQAPSPSAPDMLGVGEPTRVAHSPQKIFKKLSEVSAQVVEWYATKMAVTTPESQVLKDKAAALLALQLQPA